MAFSYSIFQEAEEDLDNALAWYTSEGGIELSTRFLSPLSVLERRPAKTHSIFHEFMMNSGWLKSIISPIK